MQKWEYLRLDITHTGEEVRIITNLDLARTLRVSKSELINSLDNLGDQNWEMVSVFRTGENEIHYFKRPIESA
jgi:hypothetical protein